MQIRAISVYEQMHSVFYQYTNRFILCIQWIRSAKLRLKIYLIPHILLICKVSLCIFMNWFIPRILSIHTDLFRIFSECTYIISNIWNEIIFFTAFKETLLYFIKQFVSVQLDPRPTRNNWLFCFSLTKKFFCIFQYYTEWPLNLNLKNRSRKSHASGPLR
jgi:hypothetical protein